MASLYRVALVETEALTGVKTGSGVSLEPLQDDFIGYIEVSGNTGNLDCDIEHSADGVTWLLLKSFTQITVATGAEAVQITEHLLPRVRAVVTPSANATVTVMLYHDKK